MTKTTGDIVRARGIDTLIAVAAWVLGASAVASVAFAVGVAVGGIGSVATAREAGRAQAACLVLSGASVYGLAATVDVVERIRETNDRARAAIEDRTTPNLEASAAASR